MGHEAGEDLHVAGVEPLLVLRQGRPLGDPRGARGEHGVLGDHPGGDLTGEDLLAVGLPAVVEGAAVGLDPLRGDLVRCVRGAGGQVGEERLAGRRLLLVLDHPDRLVDEVLGEVVALLGGRRRLDVVVVADQLRRPLAGLGAEEAVVLLEADAQRPPVEGTRGGGLRARHQVPLPDRHGVVAGVLEQPRHRRGAARDASGVAGEAESRLLGDAHADRVVVATGEQRGPGRGADRGHVEALVAQPATGDLVDPRGRDARAEAPELGEADVVEHDHQHVGGTLRGARVGDRAGLGVQGGVDDVLRRQVAHEGHSRTAGAVLSVL